MKKAVLIFLTLFMTHLCYANQPDLYSDTLVKAIKNHLPETAKLYIDDVKSSDNNLFVSVVEYYENKPPHPHLFVMNDDFKVLKDIIIEDFSYFRGLMLEDIDQDMIEDVIVMTGTGANSNRIDIFLNNLREKNDLVNIFTETGNYTLRFYVALNVPTVEIASWTGTLDHPVTVFKWNGKEFVVENN